MTKPLVSIIIPTYSRPDNLCRAIDSVLRQTYKPIEIIVVDDNGIGTEFQKVTALRLAEYLKDDKIIYIKHEVNKNGSAARNTGLKASKGDFVGFLDDDDVFEPEKIELQVNRLMEAGRFDACYCNTLINNPKRTIRTRNVKEGNLCYDILTMQAVFNTSTILFRRQALLDINGWDERYKRHQDWEMMVRFFRNHEICIAARKQYLVKKFATKNVISRNPLCAIEHRSFFLNEIKQDIDNSPNPKKIYRAQMEDLALSLLSNGAKQEGREQFKKIFKYGCPSTLAFAKLIYYAFLK